MKIFFTIMIKKDIGTTKIEKGFVSCMIENYVIKLEIKLEIQILKGTKTYITGNKIESEIILPCNTEYRVTDAEI